MKYLKPFNEAVETKLTKDKIRLYNKELFLKDTANATTLIEAIQDDFISIEDAKELELENVNVISSLKLFELGFFTKEEFANTEKGVLKYKDDDIKLHMSLSDLEGFMKKDDRDQIKGAITFDDDISFGSYDQYYWEDRKSQINYNWRELDQDVINEIKAKMVGVEIDLTNTDLNIENETEQDSYIVKAEDFTDDNLLNINDEFFDIEDVVADCEEFEHIIVRPFINALCRAKESADTDAAFKGIMYEIEDTVGPFDRPDDDEYVFSIFTMTINWKKLLEFLEEENADGNKYDKNYKLIKIGKPNYSEDPYGGYIQALTKAADSSYKYEIQYNPPQNGWDGDIDKDYFNDEVSDKLAGY